MANNQALVNGQAFAWVDINVNLLGRTVEGITRINYATTQQKHNNFGRGRKAVSRSNGNEENTGSISITKEEFQALQNSLPPGKKITDIKRFDIPVAYLNDSNIPVTDILQDVEFTGVTHDMQQADGQIVVECPLIVGDIIYSK